MLVIDHFSGAYALLRWDVKSVILFASVLYIPTDLLSAGDSEPVSLSDSVTPRDFGPESVDKEMRGTLRGPVAALGKRFVYLLLKYFLLN